MMTPAAEAGPEAGRIFSPRPTAVVKPFDFPGGPGATNFYNPSYDKPAKAAARPTSAARTAPPAEDQEHYLVPRLEEDEDHYLTPRLQEDEDHYLTPRLQEDEDHYLAPRDFGGSAV